VRKYQGTIFFVIFFGQRTLVKGQKSNFQIKIAGNSPKNNFEIFFGQNACFILIVVTKIYLKKKT
jgi:hypothetical protein